MDARDKEQTMLDKCIGVAIGQIISAADQVDASIFRLAASALRTYQPKCADALWRASEAYFAAHPGRPLPPAQLILHGHISTLPRLRSMLVRQLGDRERG
ncbi:hypothetical protein [Bordetella sp. N]|uniref:hypothetical protein n=1 Tax=Bordetella sp. N TaxID=1746199 RepID=UPI00070A6FDF|nr:hypothetical protein [Bordetella sp. N]ALM85300.1 hypothetical protein ASB57_22090 [Bordetella sp. N]